MVMGRRDRSPVALAMQRPVERRDARSGGATRARGRPSRGRPTHEVPVRALRANGPRAGHLRRRRPLLAGRSTGYSFDVDPSLARPASSGRPGPLDPPIRPPAGRPLARRPFDGLGNAAITGRSRRRDAVAAAELGAARELTTSARRRPRQRHRGRAVLARCCVYSGRRRFGGTRRCPTGSPSGSSRLRPRKRPSARGRSH